MWGCGRSPHPHIYPSPLLDGCFFSALIIVRKKNAILPAEDCEGTFSLLGAKVLDVPFTKGVMTTKQIYGADRRRQLQRVGYGTSCPHPRG